MYLLGRSGELPYFGDGHDPLVVGPFKSKKQLEEFLNETGRLWRSDGASVFSPEAYLKEFRKRKKESKK
jgi:hypothetical protein